MRRSAAPPITNEELERDREKFIDEHRDELRAQIAIGVAQAERGELVDGEEAMEQIRLELIALDTK